MLQSPWNLGGGFSGKVGTATLSAWKGSLFFADGPGFHQGDEIEFVADDMKRTGLKARVVRRVFDVNAAFVRVYLTKLN